jgi:hypothetical protein
MPGSAGTTTARTDLLRAVLELAADVARVGDPAAVPPPLRPYVRMAKRVPRALVAADRAGDDDDFRALVATLVGPEDLNPAEQLWLGRPEGWEEALAALVADHATATEEADARRRLERDRRARVKAESARDTALAEVAQLRAEVQTLRGAAEADANRARDEAARAETLAAERAHAVRSLKTLEAAHQRLHHDMRALRAEVRDRPGPASGAAEERSAAPASAMVDPTSTPAASAPAPDAVDASPPLTPAVVDPPEPSAAASVAPVVHGSPLDRAAVAAAVDRSSRAAAALAASLADVAALVAEPTLGAGEPRSSSSTTVPPAAPGAPTRPRRRAREGGTRRVAPLPGGVHDDSAEAAAHLVRLPRAALLVDGYNITMATWPDQPISDQRQRLVAALDGLEARCGIDTTVVFDGVEEGVGRGPAGSRRLRVQFTAEGIEADDVILDLVDGLPEDRPVVVASDDGRVRAGARARGANVVGIGQLRSLLG